MTGMSLHENTMERHVSRSFVLLVQLGCLLTWRFSTFRRLFDLLFFVILSLDLTLRADVMLASALLSLLL